MTIKQKDFIWIVSASILILILSSLPTWAGHSAETETLRFRGLHYDTQDYAVHLSMMQAGAQGEWGYQFRFTTEPHNPAYLRMFYITLGHLSRWTGLASSSTFELARWTLGIFALLALYALMRKIFRDLYWARVAFVLAATGSGLGWLQLALGAMSTTITPIDFWLIDDYVFFSLSVFPHFAFVTAGMCIIVTLWLDYLESPRWQTIGWIIITSLAVQIANPIALATVDIGLLGATIFQWWRQGSVRRGDLVALFVIALAQIPLLAYNYLVLSTDPIWSQFTAQNKTPSPPFDYYLWGFGLFWLGVGYGLIVTAREKSPVVGMALFWFFSGLALAYAPVEIQRRFLQNATIPLAVLGASALERLFGAEAGMGEAKRRRGHILVLVVAFIASLSSIQLSLGRVAYVQTHPEDLYYPASLDAALAWLNEHAHYNDFALASEATSQIIAQRTGLRVYLGHEMETLHYVEKQANVLAFYRGEMPSLASPPIEWVIYGPNERMLAPNFSPPENLELVYDVDEVSIYRVQKAP